MPGNLKPGDFFLGGKVLVYSRLMTIVDFGDPYTRRKLGPASDTATVVLSPDSYRNLGEILAELTSTGMTVTKLQSFLLGLLGLITDHRSRLHVQGFFPSPHLVVSLACLFSAR